MKRNISFRGKKGSSVIDIMVIIVVLLVVGLAWFFINYSFDEINMELQADPDMSADAKSTLSNMNTNFTKWADFAFGFFFFGLVLFIIVSSYLIDTNPLFMVISAILFIFVIFVGANLSNVFEETVDEAEVSYLQTEFPITMYIMTHLVIIIIILFALMLIVLYGKGGNGGGQ